MLNTVSGPVRSSRIMSGCTSMPTLGRFAGACCACATGATRAASETAAKPVLNVRRSTCSPSYCCRADLDRPLEVLLQPASVQRQPLQCTDQDAVGDPAVLERRDSLVDGH